MEHLLTLLTLQLVWWLTDVQLRATKAGTSVPRGDEDGPAGHSSGEDPLEDAATKLQEDFALTDSDPENTDEDDEPRYPHSDDSYTFSSYVEHESQQIDASYNNRKSVRSATRDRSRIGSQIADNTGADIDCAERAQGSNPAAAQGFECGRQDETGDSSDSADDAE